MIINGDLIEDFEENVLGLFRGVIPAFILRD
jgi:hypothetical protein